TLQDEGILTRSDDPSHGLKAIYRLTEAGIDLLPVLATLGAWGSRYRKADDDLARIADRLAAGGDPAIKRMKERLRAEHLG
ncbi:MAG: helix-turn-helix transcriptional regulator, partial [Mesorhizobium sp.]